MKKKMTIFVFGISKFLNFVGVCFCIIISVKLFLISLLFFDVAIPASLNVDLGLFFCASIISGINFAFEEVVKIRSD